MPSRDYRDVLGGALLILIGLGYSWYAASHYNLGTMRRMGPGVFPAALGVTLATFGVMIVVPALFRKVRNQVRSSFRIWSPLFVLSGVAVFALTLPHLGLIPAIIAVTVVSSFAELKVRPVRLTILCALLSIIAFLTFRVGLGLHIPMFRWPF